MPEEWPQDSSALFGAVIPGSDELEMVSKYFNKIMIINDLLSLASIIPGRLNRIMNVVVPASLVRGMMKMFKTQLPT